MSKGVIRVYLKEIMGGFRATRKNPGYATDYTFSILGANFVLRKKIQSMM